LPVNFIHIQYIFGVRRMEYLILCSSIICSSSNSYRGCNYEYIII